MKGFHEIRRPVERFLNITLKHEGSYVLKEYPFKWGVAENIPPPAAFKVDRWTPTDERGKNRISSFRNTAEGWLRVGDYPVWYGFEPVAEVSKEHYGEYFDLIIIRPSMTPHLEALLLVSKVIK